MKAAFLSAALFGLLATAVPIDKRLDLSITENDIKNGICRNITVIFARGTTELGNVGADAGPPFFNALELAVGAGKVAVQGVDYPADIPGYLVGGSPAGGTTMANLTTQAATQCPDTQIVLSGYSQGAQLVHLASKQITAQVASRVAAVVMFGDPDDGQTMPNIDESIVKVFCFSGDLICKHLPIVDVEHLAYGVDAVGASNFVKQHVQL